MRHRPSTIPMLLAACAAIAFGCDSGPPVLYRGTGLSVDTLPSSDLAAVYRATLAGAFTLNDTSLSIVVDPLLLPRTKDLTGGDTMPPDVLAALRSSGLVKGICKVPVRSSRTALICRAERAGYAVRFSEPFRLGPDSVQVHLVVQQYAIPTGRMAERLRFERAYHVARRGSTWRALREARLSEP